MAGPAGSLWLEKQPQQLSNEEDEPGSRNAAAIRSRDGARK